MFKKSDMSFSSSASQMSFFGWSRFCRVHNLACNPFSTNHIEAIRKQVVKVPDSKDGEPYITHTIQLHEFLELLMRVALERAKVLGGIKGSPPEVAFAFLKKQILVSFPQHPRDELRDFIASPAVIAVFKKHWKLLLDVFNLAGDREWRKSELGGGLPLKEWMSQAKELIGPFASTTEYQDLFFVASIEHQSNSQAHEKITVTFVEWLEILSRAAMIRSQLSEDATIVTGIQAYAKQVDNM